MNGKAALQTGIVGHADVRAHLLSMFEAGCLPHALIFSGTAGVGKFATARALAAAILSEGGPENAANLALSGSHPDLHVIELGQDKKDVSVEAVRELIGKLSLKPYLGTRAVGIIDSAQRMSISAANAMLMTLEEPSPGNYLILVSEAAHRLPATILSRCRTINFSNLSGSEVEQVLSSLAPDLDKKLLADAVRLSRGALGGLQLSQLLDPRTKRIEDPKAFAEHLSTLCTETGDLRKRLTKFLADPARAAGDALALSSIMLKGTALDEFAWQELISQARSLLRSSNADPAASAEWLLQIVAGKQLVEERNLNAEIQLANILLNAPRWDESPSKT